MGAQSLLFPQLVLTPTYLSVHAPPLPKYDSKLKGKIFIWGGWHKLSMSVYEIAFMWLLLTYKIHMVQPIKLSSAGLENSWVLFALL